eukprot:3136856-Pleurochrysis_carterae.AAC.6
MEFTWKRLANAKLSESPRCGLQANLQNRLKMTDRFPGCRANVRATIRGRMYAHACTHAWGHNCTCTCACACACA